MPSFPQFNPTRIRSYVFRLPLFTRGLVLVILALYIATIPLPWLREFAQLEPAKMDLTQSMLFSIRSHGNDGMGLLHALERSVEASETWNGEAPEAYQIART
jgi:hypothetical protein